MTFCDRLLFITRVFVFPKCLRWIHGECSGVGFEAEEDLPEYFVCKHPQCTASGGSDGSHGDADIIDQSMTAAGINVCGSTPSLGLVEAEKWVACVMTLMTSSTSIFLPSRTLMGCTDPLRKEVNTPHQCPLALGAGSKLPHLC